MMTRIEFNKKKLYFYPIVLLVLWVIIHFGYSFQKKQQQPNMAQNDIQSIINHTDIISQKLLADLENDKIEEYYGDSVRYIILKNGEPFNWNSEISYFPQKISTGKGYLAQFTHQNDTLIYNQIIQYGDYTIKTFNHIGNTKGDIYITNDSDKKRTYPFNIQWGSDETDLKITNQNGDHVYLTMSNISYAPNTPLSWCINIFLVTLMIAINQFFQRMFKVFNKLIVWPLFLLLQSLGLYIIFTYGVWLYDLNNTHIFQTIVFTVKEKPLTLGQLFYITIISFTLTTSFYLNFYKYVAKTLIEKSLLTLYKLLTLVHYFFIIIPIILFSIKENQTLYAYYDFSKVSTISLLAIAIIILNVLSIVFICYGYMPYKKTKLKPWQHLIITTLCGIMLYYFTIRFNDIQNAFYEYAFIVLAFFCLLSYSIPPIIKSHNQQVGSKFKIFTFSGFVWCILLCIWVTNILFISNYEREKLLRKEIAQNLNIDKDHVGEYKLQYAIHNWTKENKIVDFLQDSITSSNKISHFSKEYLPNFKLSHVAFYNKENLPQKYQSSISDIEKEEETWSSFSNIDINQRQYYYIYADFSFKNNQYAVIEFSIPEYYVKNKINTFNEQSTYAKYYSVAIYYNKKLKTISGIDENAKEFDKFLETEGFEDRFNSSYYTQHNPDNQTIIIKYSRFAILQYLSSLSYCIITLFTMCYVLIISYRKPLFFFKFAFKDRINLSVISIVTIAFVLLSIISISFLNSEVLNQDNRRLNEAKHDFQKYVNNLQYISNNYPLQNDVDAETLIKRFPYNNLLSETSILTVYDTSGINVTDGYIITIEPNVLLAYNNFINNLNTNNQNILETKNTLFYDDIENVYYVMKVSGKGKYIVKFSMVKNDIYNNYSINNIITMLINTYVLLFLLSVLFTIIIVNNFTKGLQTLTNQIRKFSLTKNTPIKYDNNDEIAVLVKEYNLMLKNVEVMAANLANSERESAWREAAKQVAHEINNPITPIKLNIQYLINQVENKKDISELFLRVSKSIISEIDKLSKIAESFSTYGSMTDPIYEKIDIVHHIRSVCTILYVDLNIKLIIETPDEPVYVNADEKFLNIVFMNIIKNGFHALEGRQQPMMKVLIETTATHVNIHVQDNGVGMSEEVLSKIFVPNFTTKNSGKGIGLSTTKSMITSMNGIISVTSQQGIGTTFHVTFPLFK